MTDRPMIYRDDAIAAISGTICFSPHAYGSDDGKNWMDGASEGMQAALAAIRNLDPVQVDAAHIRAEALRAAGQVLTDEIEIARIAMPQGVPILAAVRRAILALIATPAPSPDVGGGSTGFGASYQRETDCWVIYSLPRMAPFARMDGFANENVKWAVEALRAAHIRSSPSPDVGALVRDLLEGYGANYIDSETWEKVTTEARAFLALAKMKGGAARALAAQEGGE